MRFVHTSDLHLGRKLDQMSLEGDMQAMLDQLTEVVSAEHASALVVAGDVFDAPVPPETAVRQWDAFATGIAARGVRLLVVSGNHDSGARLAMGHGLLSRAGFHVAGDLVGEVEHVSLGEGGELVTFWLVPFARPSDVRSWAHDLDVDAASVVDYTSALRLVLDHVRGSDDFSLGRNVVVAHQFVTAGSQAPERSDSERLTLGTLDDVDVSVFEGFDYVALGHIHRPQRIGRDSARYAGSPLKLSASEIPFAKSFAVVDVAPSGEVATRLVPVVPLRDFREVRGRVDELLGIAAGEPAAMRSDFVRAIVTDDDPLDVVARLRRAWPNLVRVDFDNASTRAVGAQTPSDIDRLTSDIPQLFSRFFCEQAGAPLTEAERELVVSALEDVSHGGDAS